VKWQPENRNIRARSIGTDFPAWAEYSNQFFFFSEIEEIVLQLFSFFSNGRNCARKLKKSSCNRSPFFQKEKIVPGTVIHNSLSHNWTTRTVKLNLPT